ncbi:flagellar biosynthesis anti-sigma factor FlgM [Candidatus Methylomirabilis sp.]|uniref:flagellar biosynthesis anti-sigma factor FlgM n=1 Tax=Candidatus Methylomirabilis sp. TaxID=2032687 RepID=UPI002A67EC2C|nr:flagellar biosynthesis anti-sigma factor FlgM [Candidatus Methylomirabilis sp.]
MKIENRSDNTNINPHLNRVQDAAERSESKEPTPAREASADRVELSGAARALQQARQLLAASPEVRLEKVTELKSLIQKGAYNVRGEAVAAKMLGQGLFDQLV